MQLTALHAAHPKPRHSAGTTACACAPAPIRTPTAACELALGCLPLRHASLPNRVCTPSTSSLRFKKAAVCRAWHGSLCTECWQPPVKWLDCRMREQLRSS
jgi:hypothetical protein